MQPSRSSAKEQVNLLVSISLGLIAIAATIYVAISLGDIFLESLNTINFQIAP